MKTGTGENWTRHLGPDVAHEVCNIMTDVLDNLRGRSGIDGAFDQIDDAVMAELELEVCNIIEPHVRFIYADGYNDADWENET